MTKPLYFYNGTTFELVGPTTPQSPIAYQTSAPTAPATGDIWIDSDGDVDTYNRQLTRYYFVATAGQTSITGVDANGLTLAYVAGSEAVYVNGALQVRGQDYTATNGTSITGLSALAVNDVVEIFAYTAFTVANAYTKTETDSVAAAAPGMRLIVPTSVSVGSGSGSANANGFVTFSGASSVSLNGVFSSTYDNYKIVIETTASTGAYLNFRLRLSGTDNSAASYSWGFISTTNGGTAYQLAGSGATSSNVLRPGTARNTCAFTICNPAIARETIWSGTHSFNDGATVAVAGAMGGIHAVSTAYDGFTLTAASGTITGTVGVYGYKD